eukprot:6795580-Prymnesium_polylepis.1
MATHAPPAGASCAARLCCRSTCPKKGRILYGKCSAPSPSCASVSTAYVSTPGCVGSPTTPACVRACVP